MTTDFNTEIISSALATLRQHGTLLYPTDTIWGIGCDARSDQAVEKIYQLKQRDDSKALICLVDSYQMLTNHVVNVSPQLLPYLDDERPTTVIYPQIKGVSKRLIAADGSIGIRIVKDPFCAALIKALNAPLVSTSANLSGEASPQNFNEISTTILEGVEGVVPLRQNESSTQASRIIKLMSTGEIKILRP